MTASKKAEELVNKFLNMPMCESVEAAKYAANICINEIKMYKNQIEKEYDEDFYHAYGQEDYLEEVLNKIGGL